MSKDLILVSVVTIGLTGIVWSVIMVAQIITNIITKELTK